MNELNQNALFHQAHSDHQRLISDSAEARLANSIRPTKPGMWDSVALTTGDWLIKLGNTLKEQSIYTQLSEKHA